jgi:phosphoribosylaminoimidazole (AIR) synthetase
MTLNYGDKEELFTITTRAKKTIPIGLDFTPVNSAELQTIYTSNTITISGLEMGYVFTASITAGELIKNGTIVGDISTGVENGDTLAIRLVSSPLYNVSKSSVLTL